MDVTDILGYVGYIVAILSAIFAYLYRGRYKTLITDIYEPGNKELREQLATARTEITVLCTKSATLEATNKEKNDRIEDLKEYNSKQPDFSKIIAQGNTLAKQMSDNHLEVMKKLAEIIRDDPARKRNRSQ